MGMSAGQARLLSITKRISNNEFRSQMVTNSKLRLAEQSAEASDEYMKALNSKQLMFGTYDENSIKSYTALTPNLLTSYSDLKNQYAMVTSSGKILVSGTDLKNYEASNGDLNVFLEDSGVSRVEPDVDVPSTEILQYTKNLLQTQFHCWEGTGIDGLPLGANGKWSGYQPSCCEHVLASILWDQDWDYSVDGQQTMQFKIDNGTTITITNTSDTHNTLSVAGKYDGINLTTSWNLNSGICYKNTALDIAAFYNDFEAIMVDGRQETLQVQFGSEMLTAYAWKGSDGRTYYTTYDMLNLTPPGSPTGGIKTRDSAGNQYNGVYLNYNNTEGVVLPVYSLNTSCIGLMPYSHKDNDVFGIAQILEDNLELKHQLQIAYYKVLCYLAQTTDGDGTNPCNNGYKDGVKAPPYGGIAEGFISNIDGYSDMDQDSARDAFSEAMALLTAEVVYGLYMNDPEQLKTLLGDDNFKHVTEIMGDYIAQKNEYTPDTTDAKYQWYVNLWYRMGGGDESQKNYKEIDPTLFNSAEWLEFALEHGMITLEQAKFNADGSAKYPEMGTYDWDSIVYTSASDIVSQDDEIAIARAEVTYKNKLTEIDNKDKKYEQDLKKLDTEHTALQTEYDSTKEVITKNVERSFKAFS